MTASNQTFGIEIEAHLPRGKSRADLAAALTAAGVAATAEHYNHTTRRHWKVITDASLGYDRGVEIVSPVLTGLDGLELVRKAADAIKAFGCTVDRRCGLHIHVGFNGATVDQFKALANTYIHFEEAIDSIMPRSRRANNNNMLASIRPYKARIDAAQNAEEVIRATPTRYLKLNLQSFWRHGTVEFRHHSGTVESTKILNWLAVCLTITAKARTAGAAAEPTPLAHYRGVPVTREIWSDSWAAVCAMRRPEGATEEQLKALTGWRRVQPAHRCRLFGYGCKVTKENGVKVYRATFEGAEGFTLPAANTIDALMAHLGLAATATADYIAGRQQHFAQA
jgi:hypothetical protein